MIPLAIRKAAPTLPAKTRKAFFALLRKVRSLTERQWTIVGIAIVALMAAGPIWFVTYDLIGQKAWKNYEAAARARGEKLYLADMEEPSISDADNFAALPIFRNTLSTNQRIPAFPKGDRPTFASAQTGIRFDVDLLRTYFAKAGWIDSPSQDIAGDIRLALLPYQDAIEEINGGLKRPHCSFGTTWTPNPYKTSLSYPRVIYPLVDVVALHANAHLAEGNSEAALEDLRLITGIRNHLASAVREQTSNLRVKISGLQASIVYEGLARHAWNQQQLRDIIELLKAADPLKDMADWLEMERAIANGWFDWILAGNLPAPSNLADYTPERWFHNVKILRTFPGIVRRNQLQVAKFYSGLRAEIDLAAGVCPVSKLKLSYDYSAYYWLAYFPIEGIDDWRRFYLVHAARSRLALIACALELYHSRHLRYPPSLLELAPSYLPTLPHEPTKKRNFIYYPTDDGGYRLYSRGPNGKDDRGALGRYKLSEKESRSYPLHKMADVPWTAPPPR